MSFTASQLAGLQTSKYFNVAGMAILVFDYAITLEDEIRWVWGRPWDTTRVIFTISRYLPFAGAGMTLYAALCSGSGSCRCGPSVEENITHTLGVFAAELLLIIRTYVFWQSDKRILFGLLAYGILTVGAVLATRYAPTPLIPEGVIPQGCYFISSRESTFMYLFLLIFEMVVLSLMAYNRFRGYRDVRASIVRTVYRDGMFYIVCIILITFTNVIVVSISPLQFTALLNILQITLHSVLASRIVFNLRKSVQRLRLASATDSVVLSDIAYCTRPSGQLCPVSESSASGSGSRGATDTYVDEDVERTKLESKHIVGISKV